MSEPLEGEAQEIDELPQLAGQARIVQARPVAGALAGPRDAGTMLPAVQAAAVAAGGFVAGAAFAGLVHRRQRRRSSALSRGRRRSRDLPKGAGRPAARAAELVQIVGSRSLLVDVHLLGSGGDR
ncbi:MAG TPA: hypothetical protein VK252_03110 [Solirubrobacteraceae bacterium]|nr:hypothetical protein [Solirubrobacteraceae bacterium]